MVGKDIFLTLTQTINQQSNDWNLDISFDGGEKKMTT